MGILLCPFFDDFILIILFWDCFSSGRTLSIIWHSDLQHLSSDHLRSKQLSPWAKRGLSYSTSNKNCMIDGDLKTSTALTIKSRHSTNHPNPDSILSAFWNTTLPVSRTFPKCFFSIIFFSDCALLLSTLSQFQLSHHSSTTYSSVSSISTWFYPLARLSIHCYSVLSMITKFHPSRPLSIQHYLGIYHCQVPSITA